MSAITTPLKDPPHPRTTQAAEGLPRRRFTVAEIEGFVTSGLISEDERFELIGGELVPISPKGLSHERWKTALTFHFVRTMPAGFLMTPETTFRLSEDTFLEPDFVFYDARTGLEGLDGRSCLLAAEISISSLAYDRGRKAWLYASFAVPELWVLDVGGGEIIRHRDPAPDGYRDVVTYGATRRVEALNVPGISLQLADHV